jgi:hypothetical protein
MIKKILILLWILFFPLSMIVATLEGEEFQFDKKRSLLLFVILGSIYSVIYFLSYKIQIGSL